MPSYSIISAEGYFYRYSYLDKEYKYDIPSFMKLLTAHNERHLGLRTNALLQKKLLFQLTLFTITIFNSLARVVLIYQYSVHYFMLYRYLHVTTFFSIYTHS